tara:strand:- start:693 stop:899 length:207 start_codon:yes stop_codon:yes gene_type:complete
MSFELLILGGYGQFVWPAFIFTFVSFFMLYLKTKKALQEQEKAFLVEYKKSHILDEKVLKEALSGTTI